MKAGAVSWMLAAGLALASASHAAGPQPQATWPAQRAANPFFALCMDTHDSRKRDLRQQAAMLKELGYDGAGHLWLGGLAERLKTLDEEGLKLFQVYVRVDLRPGKAPYDGKLRDALPLMKGRGVMLALLIEGGRPSDPNGDARAVEVVREIADLARESDTKVALYPHSGFWLERVEDALRVAEKADRANVGVMFNLCHWLKVDDEKNLAPLLKRAMPRLLAVSIHGADSAAEIRAGKGNWIQPLDSGSFDVSGLLKALRELGYRGPVGLQCYGLPGDARDHLARSMAAWRKLNDRLDRGPAASQPMHSLLASWRRCLITARAPLAAQGPIRHWAYSSSDHLSPAGAGLGRRPATPAGPRGLWELADAERPDAAMLRPHRVMGTNRASDSASSSRTASGPPAAGAA